TTFNKGGVPSTTATGCPSSSGSLRMSDWTGKWEIKIEANIRGPQCPMAHNFYSNEAFFLIRSQGDGGAGFRHAGKTDERKKGRRFFDGTLETEPGGKRNTANGIGRQITQIH